MFGRAPCPVQAPPSFVARDGRRAYLAHDMASHPCFVIPRKFAARGVNPSRASLVDVPPSAVVGNLLRDS